MAVVQGAVLAGGLAAAFSVMVLGAGLWLSRPA